MEKKPGTMSHTESIKVVLYFILEPNGSTAFANPEKINTPASAKRHRLVHTF